MKTEKFKIIQFIRELIITIDKEMDNYPKKDIELKHRIRENTFDILEIAYEANNVEDIIYKKQLLHKMIAKIKIIDFLLNLSYDKEIINAKKYYKFGNKMDDIIKYTMGWIKTLKQGMVECEMLYVAIFSLG